MQMLASTASTIPAGDHAVAATGAPCPTPRHSILIVDDDPAFAQIIADDLRDDDLAAVPVNDAREALALAEQGRVAVAILDLIMPGVDGLELSREMRNRDPDLEVILLTGHASIHSAIEGIRNEVFDYFQKAAVSAPRLRRAVRAAIARREQRRAEDGERKPASFAVLAETLVGLLDAQDANMAGHSRAVAALADGVTRVLGLPHPERRTIRFAALLHDVGKLRLGPAILAQNGPLGEKECGRMREHALLGVAVLEPLVPWPAILRIVEAHHERWDGRGYPRGMCAAQIPLGARIVAVAEAFDAMTRPNSYRPARARDEALAEIVAEAGAQFDPAIVDAFVESLRGNEGTVP
jgi:putative nucleotidyltransferase with HDIG domain